MRRGTIAVACLALSACVGLEGETFYQPVALGLLNPSWPERTPQLVKTRTDDGLTLTGWFWPPEDGQGVIVFVPGRTGNRNIAARQAQGLASGGHGLLVASYRGYGDNPGRPDEAGLYRDGAAFVALARTLQPVGKVYLMGDGLGAAVALHVAGDAPVDAVVTLGAFDTLKRFAPPGVRAFYADGYDNVRAIARVKVPVLIMHGGKDEIVPIAAAERLRAAAGGRALVAPIAGEAYHSVELAPIAATTWAALAEMTRAGGGG